MNFSIGENIKNMRKVCGYTQEELAKMLSVTPQAVSKWENGNGAPDLSQIVPLAQIFGTTTDSLLGVDSSTYGEAHTKKALEHEERLLSTSLPKPEQHLAAYRYFCKESEIDPTNYTIMRKCLNHGGEISIYADFEGFLADQPKVLEEIYADCERKNNCITRYCEDRANVEKSNYCMAWIYFHLREFDKAKKLISNLPSLDSNNLQEQILPAIFVSQNGFEYAKPYYYDGIMKLFNATTKLFYHYLEAFAWHGDKSEATEIYYKFLAIMDAYKAFDGTEEMYKHWKEIIKDFPIEK